ncbi:class II aldolase/adducin family protein [Marinivivus vitaminiproducens]|uniref:class II aldolase/adducin family protein n=1 Tax=Marinivivus vitaminiproducens TaxID=3035935 RepID=UPI0027A54FEB|nr:class II aldolase/adducin family protein [Geminicoccaceae bacterium SCSIO 64248]
MAELNDLAAFSHRIGSDPEQVQAAGGNTSLKDDDGVLWVKASGLWLADALERPIFVPVALRPLLAVIDAGLADPVSAAVVGERNPEGLRPSIETTLHGLLPHRVVVHTHSVRTIALAIRADAEALLAERLDGIAWRFVPYRQPGLPLTQAMAERLRDAPADVLVLGNHGLVVGGADLDAAERLLAEVERRLDAPVHPGRPSSPDCKQLPGLRPVRDERVHRLAYDHLRLGWAEQGSLYPDHVIFLGPAVVRHEVGDRAPGLGASKLLLWADHGAFLPEDATRAADELALCLALVLERVPDDARLAYLTADDEAALLDWDAEKYRQALEKQRSGG